jgi:DNA-binding SARP family transcriptional activator
VEFGLLGPITVRIDGHDVEVRGAHPRATLAILLLRCRSVVSVTQLVDGLWGDSPPDRARLGVQGHVKRLRQMLGPAGAVRLATKPPGYRLDVEPDELDLDRFQQLVAQARSAAAVQAWDRTAADLSRALALWRAEPLQDVPQSAAIRIEARRLEELRLQCLEWRIDADLRCGRAAELIAELRSLRAEYPLHERFCGQLMVALSRCGRQAEAFAAFHQARAILHDELGVAPSPQLQALQRQLLRMDDSAERPEDPIDASAPVPAGRTYPTDVARPSGPPVPVPPHGGPRLAASSEPAATLPDQLPSDVPDFSGRESEIVSIMDVLRPDLSDGIGRAPWSVPLTVITGPGGIGKTALAVHVAHLLRPSYPGGCLFVSLAGEGSGDGQRRAMLGRVLRALGVPPEAVPYDHREATALYRTLLSGRRILLLIDDATHPDQVAMLVPGSADCAVMVTSRSGLAGLDGAFRVTLDELSADQAGAIIRGIVGASRTDGVPEAVSRLCALCGNLPLALRVAGTKLALRPGWAVRDLVEDLSVNGWVMDPHRSDDATMRLVLGLGHNGLSEPDARAFRLLAATSMREFSIQVAAALLDTGIVDARRTAERLVDVHLLGSHSRDHYWVGELHYQYARQELVRLDPDLLPAAVRRATRYYLDALARMAEMVLYPAPAAAGTDTGPGAAGTVAAWLDAEYQHVHALAADNRHPSVGEAAAADQLLDSLSALTACLTQAAAR